MLDKVGQNGSDKYYLATKTAEHDLWKWTGIFRFQMARMPRSWFNRIVDKSILQRVQFGDFGISGTSLGNFVTLTRVVSRKDAEQRQTVLRNVNAGRRAKLGRIREFIEIWRPFLASGELELVSNCFKSNRSPE